MSKRIHLFEFIVAACILVASAASAQGADSSAEKLLLAAEGEARIDLGSSITRQTKEGFISFFATAPGQYIPHELGEDADETSIALDFVTRNVAVFGIHASDTTFSFAREVRSGSVTCIHLQQHYRGWPVLGGMIVVHVLRRDGVIACMADLMTQAGSFQSADFSPADRETLRLIALELVVAREQENGHLRLDYQPQLQEVSFSEERNVIYAPEVFESELPIGERRQKTPVAARQITLMDDAGELAMTVVVGASSGELLTAWPAIKSCINRQCFNGTVTTVANRRLEGNAASAIAQVNTAYDLFWHVHTYFSVVHGWDGWQDDCSAIRAVVNSSFVSQNYNNVGAFYLGAGVLLERIEFGTGWVTEDVVAHEYTHGVIRHSSNLGATNHAGALNEAFADMWGEFVGSKLKCNTVGK